MRRGWVLLFGSVVPTVASCLGPTEIQIHVTTNACASLQHVDIYVGGEDAALTAPGTSVAGCVGPNDVGTLTLVPSGAVDASLQLEVVGAVGDECTLPITPGSQCIVARRSLSYVPHTRLELPIYLDSACAGFPCDAGQTCVADPTPHCVGSTCDASGGVACGVDAGGPDASVDASIDVPILDATTGCPTITLGTPTYSWSFDGATDAVHEDHGALPTQPFENNAKVSNELPFCGNHLTGGPQPLSTNNSNLGTRTFTVGFAYRALADGTVLQLSSASQFGGYEIGISTGQLVVSFNSNVSQEVFRDSGKTNDGAWHTAIIEVVTTLDDAGAGTTVLRATRDNVSGKLTPTKIPYAGGGIGLAAGGVDAVDQITYFIY